MAVFRRQPTPSESARTRAAGNRRLTKKERKALRACTDSTWTKGPDAVMYCMIGKLDRSWDNRLYEAAFKAQRRASRTAIHKNYGKK